MSNPSGQQPKRLLTGSRISGAFSDFYDNPDPNIRRRRQLRIYGTITGACGERKYTVQFDGGQIIERFSNTIRLERPTASLPPVEIQAAVAEVEAEAEGNHAEEAARIIEDNEAAANDAEVEEHLPGGTPKDKDEEGTEEADGASAHSATEEPDPEQHPVGIVTQATEEDATDNASRKQAALRQIAALQDQVVVITAA
jgi:hypothetical protein